MDERQRRVLIAAGGTAGHVLPAIALAEELRARGTFVTFAGSPDRVEAQLVPDAGFEIDFFRITGLPRRPSPELARALLLAGRAPRACARILDRRRPHVVLGAGGFVAGPMVYAAWRQRIPAALTEADARLGLANRLAARFARRVFLSYDLGSLPAKYQVVGRPLPATSQPWERVKARTHFGLPTDTRLLLIAGARAGARALNEMAVEAFGAAGPAVLHIAGERDYESLRPRVQREDYVLVPLVEEFGAALGAADLSISRSGGTVWELAAAGLPAILVPYPFATADHQTANARYFERGGGAIVIPETRLGDVPGLARSLVDDPKRLARMGESMLRLAKPDAARVIAEELLALAS